MRDGHTGLGKTGSEYRIEVGNSGRRRIEAGKNQGRAGVRADGGGKSREG